ncbi:MAG TPA: PEP-CTERM sorting domain-containing protein [Burkholderiaceae bacterium]
MQGQALATIAAAVVSLAALPAAASTATASMSDFHIELIDLDPADGILPAVSFQNVQGGPFIAAESGSPGHVTTDAHQGGTPFGAGSSSSARGAASALASFAGDPLAAGAGGAANASASTGMRGLYGASTVQLGDGAMYAPFTLSAETRLVITADASASALSTFDDPRADTWASVFLKLTDATGAGSVSTDTASAEQFAMVGGTPTATVDHHLMTLTFENLTGADLGGIFFGSIDAYAADLPAAAVPEPGNVALLAAGLGLMGWRLRRRVR